MSVNVSGGSFGGAGVPPVGVQVWQNVDQSIPHGILTPVTFTQAIYQRGGTLWVVGTPTRVTFPSAGLYLVCASMLTPQNAAPAFTKSIGFGILLNGVTDLPYQTTPVFSAGFQNIEGSFLMEFAANDYIEMGIYSDNDGAGNITLTSAAKRSPLLSVQKIRS